jgi:hypothetical protein
MATARPTLARKEFLLHDGVEDAVALGHGCYQLIDN